MGEFAFGRMTQTGPIGSFEYAMESRGYKLGTILGVIPVLGAFGIAVGYAVVVGWFIRFYNATLFLFIIFTTLKYSVPVSGAMLVCGISTFY